MMTMREVEQMHRIHENLETSISCCLHRRSEDIEKAGEAFCISQSTVAI